MTYATFQDAARDPETWLSVAHRLRAAAHTLWKAADFERPTFRASITPPQPLAPDIKDGVFVAIGLAGLAIENLLKALLIKRTPALVTQNGISRKLTRAHSLHDLFEKAQVDLTPEEAEFVFRAQGFVTWSSRYPVPLSAGAQPLEYYTSSSDDFEVFESLFVRIASLIRAGA